MEKEGLEKENTKKTIEAKLLVITMGGCIWADEGGEKGCVV